MLLKGRIVIIIILFLTFRSGMSQCLTLNLIKNPSLEDHTCCPIEVGQISCAIFWTQPLPYGYITSDYWNTCGIDSALAPVYERFMVYSFFGEGYAGILTSENNPGTSDYREYVQGELSQGLLAGQCYYAEFWVRPFNMVPAATSFSGIDALGIYFSDTLPYKSVLLTTHDMPFYFNAQINNPTGNVIADTTAWTKISGTFTATGGERYLTVGCFKPQSEINVVFFNNFEPNYSYYFFDNFSLCPCEDTIQSEPPEEVSPQAYVPNVFSPNGDGINDIFRVQGQRISTLEMKVYNRWGNLVFEGQGPATVWDGRDKEQDCPAGVYYYFISVTFDNGLVEERKGSVTVVR